MRQDKATVGNTEDAPAGGSPMVAAYRAVQAALPGHLVLYRVGEFYEVLMADAGTVSRTLGIQLTRRRQKDADDIPMCGIPAPSADTAIARLLKAGFKVACSEQPPEPGAGRPLRVMTPGTSVDPDVLPEGRPNNLLAVHAQGDLVGFSWIDLSTGDSGTCMSSVERCGPALARIDPSEILVSAWPDGSVALAAAIRGSGVRFTDIPGGPLNPSDADAMLASAYGPAARDLMEGFSPPELAAHAGLLGYVQQVLGGLPQGLAPPRRIAAGDTMEIDQPTLRGLEVLTSASGRKGSLLSVMDRTVTAAGARLLARQLCAPLTNSQTIARRLLMVRCFVDNPALRTECREALSGMPDLPRACGRLSLGKGGPRDLAAIHDGLRSAISVATMLASASIPSGVASAARELAAAGTGECGELAAMLGRALAPALPTTAREPGFIREGYSRKLDDMRSEAARTGDAIEALQAAYVGRTGIRGLKIRTNNVIGYHVEVPATAAKAMDAGFILRQGLASTTRYTTPELDGLAAALDGASGRAVAAEIGIFNEISSAAVRARVALGRIAQAAAALDLVTGLAQAAAEGLWTEPLVDNSTDLDIRGGRHPVVEERLNAEGRAFIENDCHMGTENNLWLLTGPNMSGKSTLLRQNPLIALMAQTGSFVPARQARVGVVDKMFSRIGASDDLATGRSTFMVEMMETAAILHQATDRSFVVLDEVGRGTSTNDGLSIAQATMEYLHDTGCRTLFATHFHELADAAEGLDHAICMAMDASAGRDGDIFSYKVRPGRAGRSYGLKVAEMAGMPQRVLSRAADLMALYDAAAPVENPRPDRDGNAPGAPLPGAGPSC